jgi:predicted transposase YdaD
MDKKIDNMMTHEMFVRQYQEEGRQLGLEEGRKDGMQQGMGQGVDITLSALQYLVQHPDVSDSAVAEQFELSLEVVARMRTTLGI